MPQSKTRTPRFSISETPVVSEFLDIIWNQHPKLRGNKAETVVFALSACAHRSDTSNQTQSIESSPKSVETEPAQLIDSLDDLDDLDT
ncbi:MAG: hypothetical protein KME18_18120 [Phormidium tanganyikae FI6-MK23]|jgi:hypothetical protein|nr:hypothetical protein [Phormidium tanganyikae FI6-MK23]